MGYPAEFGRSGSNGIVSAGSSLPWDRAWLTPNNTQRKLACRMWFLWSIAMSMSVEIRRQNDLSRPALFTQGHRKRQVSPGIPMTSRQWFTVTTGLSQTVFPAKGRLSSKKNAIFHQHIHLTPTSGANSVKAFELKNCKEDDKDGEKKFDSIYNRFDTITQYEQWTYKQTLRQTDRQKCYINIPRKNDPDKKLIMTM